MKRPFKTEYPERAPSRFIAEMKLDERKRKRAEKNAKKQLEETLKNWRASSEETIVTVTDDDIMSVVSKWTGVPLRRMEEKEAENLSRRVALLIEAIKSFAKNHFFIDLDTL